MAVFKKIFAYLHAMRVTHSFNLLGLPLIPKSLWKEAPYDRLGYNTFISWLDELKVESLGGWAIDVGANHGVFSQAISAMYPQSKVLLVEPQQQLASRLEYLAQKHTPYWDIETSALGRTEGKADIFVDSLRDCTASLLGFSDDYQKNISTQGKVQKIECSVTTLDACIEKFNIPRIDLLKIDVEGFEFEVLAGARKALKLTESLVIEISLVRSASMAEHPLSKLIQILHENGLSVISIIPSLYSTRMLVALLSSTCWLRE